MTQRCLVLGGAGFIGSHVVDALSAVGIEVRVFGRSLRNELPSGVEWFQGDFRNPKDVRRALKGCDTAVHLVSSTLPKTSNDNPVYDLESNLLPTVRFLELAQIAGLRRIVFASSGGTVYGIPASSPIPETHGTDSICSYGIHKLAIEKYLHLYHSLYGLEYCVLRIANPFGERQRSDVSQGAVAVFLEKALAGEKVVVWGDGSVVRDYVYVGDVALAFQKAVTGSATSGVFNIGSGEGLSLLQLVSSIERLLGRSVQRCHVEARFVDVPVNVLDIRLAGSSLGWSPEVPFDEGLRRMLAHRLEQLNGQDPVLQAKRPAFGNYTPTAGGRPKTRTS